MVLGRIAILVLLLGAFVPFQGQADSFSPPLSHGILKSVVSLLPDWPGYGPEGEKGKPKNPEGTAVAVLPGGYLATNVHVIGRAKTINIRLNDGRIMPAEIIGRDLSTDIALVKTPVDFPVPEFGPAPALGDKVCAIGNQFGLGLSVTCGVASALHRTGTGFNPIEDFIQTDAVVNPGGSGGALIDAKGRLIGLVSAIFTKDSDANIGVNFASSLKLVMRVAKDLKEFGRVRRGKPGFKVRDLSLNERLTTSGATGATGAAITFIVPKGAADSAGLQTGDVITAIGERKIYRATDVPSAIHMARPGEKLKIGFLRNGKQESTSLKLSP